jgi:hypothetical protein
MAWTVHPVLRSKTDDGAKRFADAMNPYREKAVQQIGATLELVGEYVPTS